MVRCVFELRSFATPAKHSSNFADKDVHDSSTKIIYFELLYPHPELYLKIVLSECIFNIYIGH